MNFLKFFHTALLLILIAGSVSAFEPVFSLEGYGREDLYSGSRDVYSLAGAGASAGQRSTFSSGYWSWYVSGFVEHYLSGTHGSYDSEQAAADIHLNRGNFSLEAGTTLNLSANTIDYGSYFQPDWSTSLIYSPAGSLWYGSLDYIGSYVYQELDNEDRVIHGLSFTGGCDRSLRFGMYLSAGIITAAYGEYYLLDLSNQETEDARSDMRFHGGLTFEGLIGFFTDWKASLYTEYFDSTANRWIEGSASLEEESEDHWMAGGEYELNWSPNSSAQYGLAGFIEYKNYLHRTILDSADISTGENLSMVRAGTNLDASWTADNALFWKLSLAFFRSFSDDPEFDTWNTGLQAGVEYSF